MSQKGEKKLQTSDPPAQSGFLAVFGTIFLSLLAFPLLYVLDKREEMENSFYVFLIGVIFLLLIGFSTRLFLTKNSNIFFYVFSIFAFSAMVDLDIGMTLDNVGLSWINFYLTNGEPYLCSSYGSAINWWDGTVHYVLYIYLTWAMATNRTHRFAGFFWVGSIMNSLIVFLPGNVLGKFGSHVKESYFLNIPYILFPIIFAMRLFRKESPSAVKNAKKTHRPKSTFFIYFDLILCLGLIFSIIIAFFRALVILDSPLTRGYIQAVEPILSCEGKWPMLQILAYVYYFVPFYVAAINCLVNPDGKTWFPDLVAIHAGAALQAQFSYIFPAIHQIPNYPSTYPGGIWIPVPKEGELIFWLVNGLLIVIPILLFFRVCFVSQVYWATKKWGIKLIS